MKLVATLFLLASVLMFTACGSSGSSKTYETQDAVPEVPNPNGTALIVSGNEGNTGISYTEVSDGSILVDCGDGGCGDVYAGSEVAASGSSTDAKSGGCTGAGCTHEDHD